MGSSRRKKGGGGDGGAPGWIVTFADLMSLLLTFFILILSFAEIDASKFKRVMGSIKMAFGVQKHKVHEFMVSSSSPFESDANGKDSDNVITSNMNDHVLNVDANELCGIEEKNKQIKNEQEDFDRAELHRKLTAESRLTKYFNILIDEKSKGLRVGIKPNSFFFKNSTKIKKERIEDLNYLFKKLSAQKLDIQITNQAKNLTSSENFREWKLTSDRSLVLAYLSQKFPQARKHDFQVKSIAEAVDSDHDDIEFFISFK